ncbi:hypothetical protein GCM10022215_20540 [Nocardioides fonticola]|uniref:Tetratricopeptide repeat protein n=1 Tax=Nocardioides fonticola TaxID=450363 RepID=A0ABP7XIE7_9ACTN
MSLHPSPAEVRRLWDFEDPVASESRLRAAADASTSAVWTTQIARALGLQERTTEALALLDGIAGHDDPVVRAWSTLERGRALRSDGDPEQAERWFAEAVEAARTADLPFLEVDALHMLALVAPPDEALAAHLRALEAARTASDPHTSTWECSILTNIGMTHADAGAWPEALTAFEEARAAALRLPDAEQRLLVADWMVAWALRHLGRRAEALEVQRDLRRRHEAAGTSDPYVEEELAMLGDEGATRS